MKYLNLGCGERFHPDWINVDSVTYSDRITKHDLRNGIPFDDASFDVVYHSHVLEHFTQSSGRKFLLECHRVLRPGGIIRVVVPDLEQITRTYLLALDKSLTGDTTWQANYNWMLLELLDQMVRNISGGMMESYIQNAQTSNVDFIKERIGKEAQYIISRADDRQVASKIPIFCSMKKILKFLLHFIRYPQNFRDVFLRLILGKDYLALTIGRFRQSGEIHQWMYDRYSLQSLLSSAGFTHIQHCSATQSNIPNWETTYLDIEPDGSIYKPDSLFMEARKS